MADDTDSPTINTDLNLSIRIPEALNEKAENASKESGLKKADVIRLAIDRGIDVLLAQLATQPWIAE